LIPPRQERHGAAAPLDTVEVTVDVTVVEDPGPVIVVVEDPGPVIVVVLVVVLGAAEETPKT